MLSLFAAALAVQCSLQTMGNDPPMFVTINDDAKTVQVTMAGRSYLEDTISDGPITYWQVKGIDGTIIRSRLNRADGTIMITNSKSDGLVKGTCQLAKKKF